MEQKTPARGTAFSLPRPIASAGASSAANSAPIAGTISTQVAQARDLAARVASIIPEKFEHVMPRGYTVSNHGLIMARFEMEGSRGNAVYGRHTNWGEKEAGIFLQDIKEHWLSELGTYMRWQLRTDPITNATFQHALVHLKHDIKA